MAGRLVFVFLELTLESFVIFLSYLFFFLLAGRVAMQKFSSGATL